jgi:hypothetical protein
MDPTVWMAQTPEFEAVRTARFDDGGVRGRSSVQTEVLKIVECAERDADRHGWQNQPPDITGRLRPFRASQKQQPYGYERDDRQLEEMRRDSFVAIGRRRKNVTAEHNSQRDER